MSCPSDSFILPAAGLSSFGFINACTAVNITSDSAAQAAMKTCCNSAPVNVIINGCYSYCNVSSSADQQAFERCFKGSGGITPNTDYACTLDENPFDSAGSMIPGTPGSTYLDGSSGTLVFPGATQTATPAASTTGTVTTTAISGQVTASANGTTSASGTARNSGKISASATSSGATATSTPNAGEPTVKQFSKGAVAILALAFIGILA